MSYDLELLDPKTDELIEFDKPHHLTGGTYAVGGTTGAWLNMTYNYSPILYRVFGKHGIRALDGMTADRSKILLNKVIQGLGTDVSDDYWECTEGNVRKALSDVLAIASERPDGYWKVM